MKSFSSNHGFTDTGLDFAAFKDGRCIAIAVKADGPAGLKHNAATLREWGGKGYDVRTMPRGEACDALLADLLEPPQASLAL